MVDLDVGLRLLSTRGGTALVRLLRDGLLVLILGIEALVLDVVICRRILHRTVN